MVGWMRAHISHKRKEITMTKAYENTVTLTGKIGAEFLLSHHNAGKAVYEGIMFCNRLSGVADQVRLLVSEDMFDSNQSYWRFIGKQMTVTGRYESHNVRIATAKKSRVMLQVRVETITETPDSPDNNQISLIGYLCGAPTCRKTPLGRVITDAVLAVSRPNGKTDYLPCIAWGKNAIRLATYTVGAHLAFDGRIQSREYLKRYPDETEELRTAYEVSIAGLSEVE